MWLILLAGTTVGESADRLAWFREAKFGMFIHWGVYSLLGRGEWVMYNEKIPISEYEKLYPRFNPTQYNPDEWVSLAKEAGMRYICVTTKHHDGFCMFDSALTDYDGMSTPAKRDFIGDLVKACRKQKMPILFYYSLLDWHHPHYVPRPAWVEDPEGHQRDFNKYLDYMFGQIEELCKKYRPDGIWFDGGWEHPPQDWRAEELLKRIWTLLPKAIINDRAGLPADYSTPEQYVPAGPLRIGSERRLWETCMTINNNWGYHAGDHNHKSVRQLVQTLVDIVSKGGNFLLNVGPMPNGLIQKEHTVRLRQIGAWLRENGEAIYGTEPSPFLSLPPPIGGCTVKGKNLYLHLFDYPTEPVEIRGLKTKVTRVSFLRRKGEIAYHQDGLKLTLTLPPIVPDPYNTIVRVELESAPVVETVLPQNPDGTVELKARFATVHGKVARYEYGHGKDNIGYWTDPKDWVSWEFILDKGGDFKVEVTFACDKGTGGSRYLVSVGRQSLEATVEETGSWTQFVRKEIGTVTLRAGRHRLSVRPISIRNIALMNLQEVRLVPLEKSK
ncbi:MAG: alpha-L-fucosidase [Armatimonadetes bacterium]|nr:alpha-L-fucosidase [Armatimonadota bacterium]MDW8121397.1 alpha-L-fucosidase [Armatimonadota bacterium]